MKRIDVAVAVVIRGQRILICRRKLEDAFGGLWEFPGGKCEPGEELEVCLARELKEELAIETTVVRKLREVRHDYPDLQITLHPYLCEFGGAEPQAIGCEQVKWVEAGQLPAYRFPSANDALLKELSRTLGARTA
jgi:A/G-specific adenine glycosylase